MSAKACFFIAALAVTAFTLASSCPATCKCEVPPAVYTPDNVDIFIFFETFDKVQILEFFRYRGMTEIVSLYEAYMNNGDELSKDKYLSALYGFYGQNPGQVVTDCNGIQDFINRHQRDLYGDDTVQFDIVYTSLGDDVFYLFEKCDSYELVVEFFRQNDMLSLLDLYIAWKKNDGLDKTLEINYRAALYKFYRNNTRLTDTVCDDFTAFVKSRSSSSSSSLLSVDSSLIEIDLL
ncbi:uncharacterized protein LOC126844315 [Adelges cooleyi]|uniref:uncharacterized protein LOC126844315 n=1 Tax=Adelges cooleyi TaxID=133065 RepID=UPI002180328A|nr:uncharacterized protein LOC126844315 [Adelges cooleyi]